MRLITILLIFISLSVCPAGEIDDLIDRGQLDEAYQYIIDNYGNNDREPAYLFLKGRTEKSGEVSATYLKDFINKIPADDKLADWARLFLGKYYLSQQLYLTARKQFETIVHTSTFQDEKEYLIARCILLSGEHKLAAKKFQAIIERFEKSGSGKKEYTRNKFYRWSVLGLADSWQAADSPQEAEIYYGKLLGSEFKDDLYAPALLGMAELCQRQKRWDDYQHYMKTYNESFRSSNKKQPVADVPAMVKKDSERHSIYHENNTPEKGYYIQVGAFNKMSNALKTSSLYRESGYKTLIENFIENGKEFHRVLVGKYNSKQQAEFVKNRLEKATREKYIILKR